MGLDKRYLFLAAILTFIAFGVSLYLYPEWTGAWGLLIVAVTVGVVGFIANFRQAFEKKEEPNIEKGLAVIKSERILDVAVPKIVTVDRVTELLVMIRRSESSGLIALLSLREESGTKDDEIDSAKVFKGDVKTSKAFEVEFSKDTKSGRAAEFTIKLVSPEFNPRVQQKNIIIPANSDSGIYKFLLTPKKVGELVLMLEVYKGKLSVAHRTIRTNGVVEQQKNTPVIFISLPISVAASLNRTSLFPVSNNKGVNVGGEVSESIIIYGDNNQIYLREDIPMAEKEKEKSDDETRPGEIHIEGSSAGGDIMASTGGEINKIGTQINNSTININSPADFRPGSAPPRPSLMIGRDDDVKALKARLSIMTDGKTSLQVLTAIKGWPGVGKTTIASALAYDSDIAKLFPDGILWTSLGQEPNILSEMATWGRALGTDEILKAKSVEEAQNLLAGLLRNKRMLLIIDDVWKAEDAFPFKVGGVGCATLITTRRDDIANALAPIADNIYRLKVLKDEDALELLKQLAPSVVKQHPNECLVLVQELEGLPLALQVAGRLLNTEANYGFGVIELIEELRTGAKLLEAPAPADRIDLVTETTPTIAALLQKSLDRLDETAKECYAYLGVFAPKPATFDMDAMKFVWQKDDPKPIIKTLVDRGLLEFVPELSRYQMHAVLVMLAKTLLTDDEE